MNLSAAIQSAAVATELSQRVIRRRIVVTGQRWRLLLYAIGNLQTAYNTKVTLFNKPAIWPPCQY